ncbi:hypothetical protein pb186bvf_008455 [Paramecium bursaria]
MKSLIQKEKEKEKQQLNFTILLVEVAFNNLHNNSNFMWKTFLLIVSKNFIDQKYLLKSKKILQIFLFNNLKLLF